VHLSAPEHAVSVSDLMIGLRVW